MNGDVIIQRVCEHRLILKEASVFYFRFLDSKFHCIRAIDFRAVCPNSAFIFRRSRKVSKGIEMVFVNVFLGYLVLSKEKFSLNVLFNQHFYLASCF